MYGYSGARKNCLLASNSFNTPINLCADVHICRKKVQKGKTILSPSWMTLFLSAEDLTVFFFFFFGFSLRIRVRKFEISTTKRSRHRKRGPSNGRKYNKYKKTIRYIVLLCRLAAPATVCVDILCRTCWYYCAHARRPSGESFRSCFLSRFRVRVSTAVILYRCRPARSI